MLVSEVCTALQSLAPEAWAESWDNVGLLIGSDSAPVSRILLTLDITAEALLLAERLGSELIVSHHPLIFAPLKSILDAPPQGDLIHRLIRRQTSVYAMHTNLDACLGGVSDALAAALELEPVATLVSLCEKQQLEQKDLLENPVLRTYLGFVGKGEEGQILHGTPTLPRLSASIAPGFGRICLAGEDLHAKPFVRRVNNNLQTTGCFVNFDKDKSYSRILVWGGSFDSSCIPLCVEQNIDCVVAGEIKHHDLLALAGLDIHAIAAGHDATERTVLPPLKTYLEAAVPDCRVAVYSGLSYNNLVY